MMNKLVIWLLQMIKERNMSARASSIAAGLNHGAISSYLSGRRPELDSCKKLADYFGVSTDYVQSLAGYRDEPAGHKAFVETFAKLTADLPEDEIQGALDFVRLRCKRLGKE